MAVLVQEFSQTGVAASIIILIIARWLLARHQHVAHPNRCSVCRTLGLKTLAAILGLYYTNVARSDVQYKSGEIEKP